MSLEVILKLSGSAVDFVEKAERNSQGSARSCQAPGWTLSRARDISEIVSARVGFLFRVVNLNIERLSRSPNLKNLKMLTPNT